MFLDGFLYNHPRLRLALSRVIPDLEITISLLHRTFTISTREEIGLLRLAWLINTSPTGHELASLVTLAGFVGEGSTFVDVGANVGLYSVPMASLGQVLGCKVVAVEPNPETAKRLKKNLAGYPCAIVIEAAASNIEGWTDMVGTSSSATFHIERANKHKRYLGIKKSRVRLFRLDLLPQLLDDTRLVLKIDVEGHESEVLDGMAGLFAGGRISAVMIDGFEDRTIPSRLTQSGFELYDGRSLCSFREGEHFNLLAVSEQR